MTVRSIRVSHSSHILWNERRESNEKGFLIFGIYFGRCPSGAVSDRGYSRPGRFSGNVNKRTGHSFNELYACDAGGGPVERSTASGSGAARVFIKIILPKAEWIAPT